jgi:hypothetical protein
MKIKSLLLATLAMIGLTASTMAQNIPSYVPTIGLQSWFPFSGNANDFSTFSNNGNVNGSTLITDRFGTPNSAYYFNGINNYITLPLATGNIASSSQMTISYWIKPTSLNGINIIFSNWIDSGIGDNTPVGFYSDITDAKIVSNYIVGFGVGSQLSIENNNWYNIITVYDGSQLVQTERQKLYINGILQALDFSCSYCSSNIPQNLGSIANSTSIGARLINGNWVEFFHGSIDDLGIWNRALTGQEINDLYNGNICYQNITVTDTLLINMGITGFNPVTYNNTIKIFPNPSSSHITIDYGNYSTMNGYQLKIENSLGQQLFQTNITQQTDYISLNNWGGNGLYFVHIIDAQGNTIDIRKIVLQ